MLVKAYAKINIGLTILYKRYDDYHELESVMASVDLHDTLSFNLNSSGKIKVDTNSKFINDKKNLVYIIASDLKKQYDVKEGVEINIKKNIPISGGMAGGSTNAAATIKTLNKLWNLNLSLDEQMKIGQKYGADIPFCINEKPALVRGVGEKLEPFEFKSDFNVIVVPMPFGLSTKKVFENLEVETLPIYRAENVKTALQTNDREMLLNNLGNNLEEVSLFLKPEIKKVKEILVEFGCFTSLMSGSGPTVLGFVDLKVDGNQIVSRLKEIGYNAYLCSIIN